MSDAMTLAGPRTPVRRRAQASTMAPYDAGATSRRLSTWTPVSASPNEGLLGSLSTIRDRSRQAVRNNGTAKGIVDKLVTAIVGTGIKPLSKSADATFKEAAQSTWLRWTDESDADGLLDFYGQQAQAARCWLEAGETFIRLRPRRPEDGLTVPLQIQVIEPELCPHSHTVRATNGNRVRAGIEFDGIGRRVAYYFHPSRPGDPLDYDRGQLVRVPADRVVHLYDPLRPGQLRGVPSLAPALLLLHEVAKGNDAVVMRWQLANMFVAFLTRNGSADGGALTPLTGLELDGANDKPTLSLEPALFQELELGEDVKFSDPPDPGASYGDFMKHQLRAACTSAGVPYELVTGDMSGLNDRVMRVLLNEFRGRIQAWQHEIVAHQVCRRVWQEWMDRAFLVDALPLPSSYALDPSPWTAVAWTPPRSPYIHPVQDVQAQREAIRAGLTSRQAVVSEHGDDAEQIDAEQAADNARADELGLTYTSDARDGVAAADPERDMDPAPQGAHA